MNSCFLGDTVLQVWGEEEEEEQQQQHQQQQQEQQGLETVSEMENGFSGNLGFFARSSSRTRFYEVRGEEQGKGHFLQACFLCKQPLGEGNDIYMYRGDTPFCSEECRQEQIEIDEAKEKSWSPTMAKKLAQRKEQQKSTNKNHNFHIRAGTVVAG